MTSPQPNQPQQHFHLPLTHLNLHPNINSTTCNPPNTPTSNMSTIDAGDQQTQNQSHFHLPQIPIPIPFYHPSQSQNDRRSSLDEMMDELKHLPREENGPSEFQREMEAIKEQAHRDGRERREAMHEAAEEAAEEMKGLKHGAEQAGEGVPRVVVQDDAGGDGKGRVEEWLDRQ